MLFNTIIAAVICILAFIIAYAFMPANKHRFIFSFAIFASVVIRFIVVFYIYKDGGTDSFGTDGLLYHNEAIKVMNQLSSGKGLMGLEYKYTFYTAFVGVIYYLTGVNRYLASYFNIISAFVSGLLLLKIALNHKYSILNSYLICTCFLFFPNLILWTTDTRKEALLMLSCFACWYAVQKLIMTMHENNWLRHISGLLFICAMMWLATVIRIYILIPAITGVVFSFGVMYRKSMLKRYLAAIVVILAAGIFLLITEVYPMTENYHAVNFPKVKEENVSDDIAAKLSTLLEIISEKNIPQSIVSCLLLPNPADVDIADINHSKELQLLVQMDMILWYVCLLLILSGIYSAIRSRNSFFLGLFAFISVYILINAFIAESVADTVYRYRSAIVGLTLLFIDGRIIKGLLVRIGVFLSFRPEDKLHAYAKYEVLTLLQNKKNLL